MTKIAIKHENYTLADILAKRDSFSIKTLDWDLWNNTKANKLEKMKPSTKERILYFWEEDLKNIPEGFVKTDEVPNIPYQTERRSVLEYCDFQRHPIPYVIVRHQDHYFFILRGSGVGESRLVGKKGMLGGHVAVEDINGEDLEPIIRKAMMRELEEEAGITDKQIQSISIKGLIKSNKGVDNDHLGIVYEVELNTTDITSEEEELTGIWIGRNQIEDHMDTFESWSKIIIDNLLLKG